MIDNKLTTFLDFLKETTTADMKLTEKTYIIAFSILSVVSFSKNPFPSQNSVQEETSHFLINTNKTLPSQA